MNGFHAQQVFLAALISAGMVCGCAGPRVAETQYPYLQPLASPGTQLSATPSTVQHTIRAEAGTAQIHHIDRYMLDEHVIFEVHFSDTMNYPPLHVALDGSVLFPDGGVAVPSEGGGARFPETNSMSSVRIERPPRQHY